MKATIAMYIRLSLEDDDIKNDADKQESNSIGNQREYITKYIREHEKFAGYAIKEFFDDGYTGRNFDRPGFQNMITECKADKISCIIVKDLSRLGRNYVEVGNLLEQLFPFLGVRIISINDGYDSECFIGQTGGIDVAFKNLIYNLYSRDLSQKVTSAVRTRQRRGEYMAPSAMFGYAKDSNDIHKLIIDEEAAKIVRRIFLKVIDGVKRSEIARILNREKVPTPAIYKKQKGTCTRDWYPDGKKEGWSTTMIAKIIRDERYVGNMVSHKKVQASFDSKKQVAVDKSEWIIVEGTHPGIVTREEFDAANANMQKRKSSVKSSVSNKKNFSVIICPHCGKRLRPSGKINVNYVCTTARSNSDSPCKDVRISKEVVENTLVQLVRNQAELMIRAEELIKKKRNSESASVNPQATIKKLQTELARLDKNKISEYERFKQGVLSREEFLESKQVGDARKQEIASAIKEMENQILLSEKESKESGTAFDIQKYVHLEKYDKQIMAALIKTAIVIDENTMEITWQHQDAYDKVFSKL